jgi:hypothetical protein
MTRHLRRLPVVIGLALIGSMSIWATVNRAPFAAINGSLAGYFATGGAFVIGDQNAVPSSNVEFWGAQWAQNNPLSGGSAPASFKGFENSSLSPTCGSSWATDPGNSSDPPASIPSDMEVVVSDHVTKSGSTISGNVVHIVMVHTNPGYQGNPGHPGTGMVISQIC